MNQRLRNELSLLALLSIPIFARRDFKRRGLGLFVTAAALKFLPLGREYRFEGKHVLITGGSRGLGLALARRFLQQGASVTLLARDEEELKRAQLRLKSSFRKSRVDYLVCDVTKVEDLPAVLREAHRLGGWIDVVVNNAGSIMASPFELMEASDFRAQVDLHLNAVVGMTRELAKYFRVRGGGRIVNITSIGGKIALPHMSGYTASKFALAGFSRAMAAELAPHNITVTTVYPGLMRTGSTIQAVFKGDQEKEFALFSAMDLMPGFSMSASKAARRIVEACRQGDVEAIIGWPAKAGAFFYQNFPEITGTFFKAVSFLLPQGHSHEARTGAASQNLFGRLKWAAPLRRSDRQARLELNQKEKRNAGFNLGAGENQIPGGVL